MEKWHTMRGTVTRIIRVVGLAGLVGLGSVCLSAEHEKSGTSTATGTTTSQKSPQPVTAIGKKTTEPASQPLNSAKPGTPVFAKPMSFGEIFQVMAGLVFVIVLIVGMMWLLKRFGGFSGTMNRNIRLIGGINVGAREKVVLVQIGNEQIVLGIAPGSVRKIHILSENIETEDTQEASDGSFSEKLKKAFGQGHTE